MVRSEYEKTVTVVSFFDVIKPVAYYGSYLYFIAAPLVLWFILKRSGWQRVAALIFLAGITVLAYARFIEPRFLVTAETDVEIDRCFDRAGAIRIGVFSDMHMGVFGNAMSLERIVDATNAAQPDVVFIAGDFVYHLPPEKFETVFAPLADLKAPVIAVLGNHDIGQPGPDVSAALQAALPKADMRLIDNQVLRLSNSKFAIELVGISDEWGYQQDFTPLETPAAEPRLVLTHHPETVFLFGDHMSFDLFIGGHTHGGQIQIPLVTCLVTNICGNHLYGLREEHGGLLFTTSGTGMIGLPMRFRTPPRVDVLNVRYKQCPAN